MTSLLLTVTTTTADQPDLSRWVALAVLLYLGYRLVLTTAFPYGPHRPCKGSGKHWNGKHWPPCRGCQGTGKRLRLGRRIWHWTSGSETTR